MDDLKKIIDALEKNREQIKPDVFFDKNWSERITMLNKVMKNKYSQGNSINLTGNWVEQLNDLFKFLKITNEKIINIKVKLTKLTDKGEYNKEEVNLLLDELIIELKKVRDNFKS